MAVLSIMPLDAGGAAAETAHLLGRQGHITISDRTGRPRFGIKGPGASAWFAQQNIALPAVNRHHRHGALRLLRLGQNDIMWLSSDATDTEATALTAAWEAGAAPKGYASWREEGWGWLGIEGQGTEAAMARLCAVDLRERAFASDAIAQTRVAQIDAVVLRSDNGFDLLFDISFTAHMLTTLHAAAAAAGRRSAT